jgi:hypothetical protein
LNQTIPAEKNNEREAFSQIFLKLTKGKKSLQARENACGGQKWGSATSFANEVDA